MEINRNNVNLPEAESAVAWRTSEKIEAIKSQCDAAFREVNLTTIHSKSELLTAIAVALHFPDYFAGNWDSFEECLAEPDFIEPPARLVIIFRSARSLFTLGQETETLFKILRDVSEEWSASGNGLSLTVILEGGADERSKAILDSVGLMSL